MHQQRIFISYRRPNIGWAWALYGHLKHRYDVFLDCTGLGAGEFEPQILENVRTRDYFIVILAPGSLDRCSERGDVFRREIEEAITSKRVIIPLFFNGFSFTADGVNEAMPPSINSLSGIQGIDVNEKQFDQIMITLSEKYMSQSPTTPTPEPSPAAVELARAQQKVAEEGCNNAYFIGKDDSETKVVDTVVDTSLSHTISHASGRAKISLSGVRAIPTETTPDQKKTT